MILQAILNGILFGAVYVCIGMGFSLVWGVMNIINLAHGSFIMLGAYITYTLFTYLKIDPFLTLPVSMISLYFIGYASQKYLLNYIIRASIFITLTFTFGLQILIANVALLIWTADFKSVAPGYSGEGIVLGGLVLPYIRCAIFIVALILTYLFYLLMARTKTGKAISATALNLEGAKTVGVDVAEIYARTMGISAALGGAAGALISPIMTINPFIGGPLVGKAFVVAILGGLGGTMGSFAGGMALGLAEQVGSFFFSSAYQEAFGFIVLVIVLIFRPQGIVGKRFY
ncbi:MAG TPA: branched-chain amino acid ABC transporter permease [Thermodesulfobacteriota bacterium]|nr:branched-chain amino acid ABC transporter permease [Thermodesulfobacteriota bacterium]